jgi:thiamine-monophosphate kinase
MVASATLLGWAPCGRAIRRSGACVGDLVLVSGTIGDGMLGLRAVQGLVEDADGFLADRYRLPRPRLDLRDMLRAHASAAADVSDGLVADAGHLARASGVALRIDLAKLPLSAAAGEWLERQPDRAQAALALATGGDDYEIVFTAPPHAAAACGQTVIGEVISGTGVTATYAGRVLEPGAGGWRHA